MPDYAIAPPDFPCFFRGARKFFFGGARLARRSTSGWRRCRLSFHFDVMDNHYRTPPDQLARWWQRIAQKYALPHPLMAI